MKENPYEDVELHGRCLGKKCVLNFPGSPTSSIPDTPAKVWAPRETVQGGGPQHRGLEQAGVLGYTGMPGILTAGSWICSSVACLHFLSLVLLEPSAQQGFLKKRCSVWLRILPSCK